MSRGARRGPQGIDTRLGRLVERLVILLASLALSVGLIVLLSGFFAGRDQPGVSGAGTGPGQAFADLGHAALRPGSPIPATTQIPPRAARTSPSRSRVTGPR